MRRIAFFISLIFPFLLIAQNTVNIQLNEGWQFSATSEDKWYEATVPGSVQYDLIRHKVLPDPYYGANETKVQWPEKKDWDFKKNFTVTADQLSFDDAVITFEGLDTHADVYLNGSRILQTQNMFIGHKVSVGNIIKEGENTLYIRFYSPITRMMPARLSNGYEFPADNDHSEEKLSIYSRKAPYHFGWDWGIRLVQMGIWKPVSITYYNDARIDDYFVNQISVSKELVEIENNIEAYSLNDQNATININAKLNDKVVATVQKDMQLKKGNNIIKLPMSISNPELWMPAGWGNQTLYEFETTIISDNKIADLKSEKIGLRTVSLVYEPDEHGNSFYFEVNGIPLFAKGTNYIPGEIMTHLQDSAYYSRLFDNITAANMNMVRIWGGGIYENDEFYRLADENGILVWQDFIFGCTPYPSDDAFLENVKEEAIYNIKRLRNHASLAMWCGNNEVEESIKYWGLDKRVPAYAMEVFKKGYDKTFRELLPSILKEHDPQKSYIHGSPLIANWGRPELFSNGDSHDWGLWHGRMPFEALAERIPRFASEFGFQSFPEMKTIRTFAEDKDMDITSEVMKIHQKSGIGNEVIKTYMDMYYHAPKNFEDFVYLGLVMQGNGMQEGIEAHRRNRPYCMGTLYWQLNDDWPVVSWSSIDYYNNWKAQHYKVRDVFAPIALGAEEKEGKLNLYVMSDLLTNNDNLRLNVKVIDFNGKVIKTFTETVSAKANSSLIVKSYEVSEMLTEDQKHNSLVHATLRDKKGKVIALKNYYFYWPNKLNLPETKIKKSVSYANGAYTIKLSSSKLAKDVFIEIPVLGAKFTDNYFDLLPGVEKTVIIRSPELKTSTKASISIKHLRETY